MEDDSTELSNSIDQIITQAEEMIFQRLPSLPCYRKITTGSLVVGTFDYDVADARMIRQVSITNSSNVEYLDHRIDSYLRDYWPNSATTGKPIMYSTKDADQTNNITITGTVDGSTTSITSNYGVLRLINLGTEYGTI